MPRRVYTYPVPGLWLPLAAYGILAASAGGEWFAMRQFRAGRPGGAQLGLLGVIVLSGLFLLLQIADLLRLDFAPQTNAYGSLFYVLSWFMTFTVGAGLALHLEVLLRSRREAAEHGHDDGFLALQMDLASMYWYFAAAAGALTYATLHLSPRLL
jgi:heme/copper-type cytochrome/quinol oxidase subunit 3